MSEPAVAGAGFPAREPAAAEPAIVADGLSKTYIGGDGRPLIVLDGVDLTLARDEVVAIIGESGSGKSTLLHLLGGLDPPGQGEVRIGGVSVYSLSDDELCALRSRRIGFIFQFHHLLREFTALENVVMPQIIAGTPLPEARARARELLVDLGLGHRLEHKPGQLSGGEQQRVAVARALANRPVVVLADEPSGNLDPSTSEHLHDVLFDVNRRHGSSMVIVTHDMALANRADRVLTLEDGRLVPVVRRG